MSAPTPRPPAALLAAMPLVLALALAGCERPAPPGHLAIAGADPERGRGLIRAYGCGTCHTIEGVVGARGVVGPPLDGFARRQLLAGIVPNVPRYLVPWIVDAPSIAPDTGMPAMGVAEAEARDMAAYLYTLGAASVAEFPKERFPPATLAPRG